MLSSSAFWVGGRREAGLAAGMRGLLRVEVVGMLFTEEISVAVDPIRMIFLCVRVCSGSVGSDAKGGLRSPVFGVIMSF